MSSRLFTLLLGPAITLIALALSIGLIELLAWSTRIDFRGVLGTSSSLPWTQPINRPDPTLIHIRKPNLTLAGEQLGGDISIFMDIPDPEPYHYHYIGDARGFRNSETLDSADIALIGDSFAESILVPQNETAASVLSQLSDKRVINFGQLWYGPQQELEVLRRFVKQTKPRSVVWLFYGGNDIEDFERYERQLPEWRDQWQRVDTAWSRSLIRNIMHLALNRRHVEAKRPLRYARCLKAGYDKPVYFWYLPKQFDAARNITLERVRATLLEAKSEIEEIGARMLLVYAPTKYEVLHKTCTDPVGMTLVAQDQTAHALAQALEGKIPFLDLNGPLIEAANRGEGTYLRDDTHWNSLGNELAAKAINEKLLELQ